MAYDLEEQEKLAELKAWWGRYGSLVTAVIFVIALGVLGFNGFNAYRLKQSSEASLVYEQMTKALLAKNQTLVKETAATLMDQYAHTAYAQMAALEAARANADAGDFKSAAAQLQWASEHALDDQYRFIAKLRLASVQMDLGQGDAAIATLSGAVPDQFAAAFADRRGDIYLARNQIAEARTQYQFALDHLDAVGKDLQVAYANVEKLKLDALASDTGSALLASQVVNAPQPQQPALAAAPSPQAAASATSSSEK